MSSIYIGNASMKSPPIVFLSDIKETDYSRELKAKQAECEANGSWQYSDVGENFAAHLGHWGSITIVKRMTGFGWWDIESAWTSFPGYRSLNNFWLASGRFDIRDYIPKEGIAADVLIKKIIGEANTCVGNEKLSWTPGGLQA